MAIDPVVLDRQLRVLDRQCACGARVYDRHRTCAKCSRSKQLQRWPVEKLVRRRDEITAEIKRRRDLFEAALGEVK